MPTRCALLTLLVLGPGLLDAADQPGGQPRPVSFVSQDMVALPQAPLRTKYQDRDVALSGKVLAIKRDDDRGIDYYDVVVPRGETGKSWAHVYFADPFDKHVLDLRRQVKQDKIVTIAVEGRCIGVFGDVKGGVIVLKHCKLVRY